MKRMLTVVLCLLMIFVLCMHTDTPLHALGSIPEIPFEEMYAVFKDYEGMNPEQIADILDENYPMDGQIPYRGSMFVHGAGGNVLLGSIAEYSGVIEITWSGMEFPIECIRGITPGMERDEVQQKLFSRSAPFWQELPFGASSDVLRITSCGELYGSPVRIELYFFFTADTLTAIKLSVCTEAKQ